MDRQLSRRRVLRTGTVLVSGLLAGCTFDNPEVSGNHLFVENRDTEEHTATITVREGDESGDVVLGDRYRIPDGTALQFEGILETGSSYYVDVEQQRADTSPQRDDMAVETESCGDDDQSGRVDVSVLLADSGPTIATWPCDRSYVYREQLTYVEPDEYVVTTAS